MQEKKCRAEEGLNCEGGTVTEADKEERVITIRPLNMEDFKEAKNQVNEFIPPLSPRKKLKLGENILKYMFNCYIGADCC